MKVETKFQLLAYSHMRGEWVILKLCDTEQEAKDEMIARGGDDYKIDTIYRVRP